VLITPPHQQAYVSRKKFYGEVVGAFGEGFQYLKTSLLHQPLQFTVREQVVIAIEGLILCPPRHGYLPPLKPEPGLPVVPYGDKGFATRL